MHSPPRGEAGPLALQRASRPVLRRRPCLHCGRRGRRRAPLARVGRTWRHRQRTAPPPPQRRGRGLGGRRQLRRPPRRSAVVLPVYRTARIARRRQWRRWRPQRRAWTWRAPATPPARRITRWSSTHAPLSATSLERWWRSRSSCWRAWWWRWLRRNRYPCCKERTQLRAERPRQRAWRRTRRGTTMGCAWTLCAKCAAWRPCRGSPRRTPQCSSLSFAARIRSVLGRAWQKGRCCSSPRPGKCSSPTITSDRGNRGTWSWMGMCLCSVTRSGRISSGRSRWRWLVRWLVASCASRGRPRL
mmetsp:Transcript_19307/g.42242  ORF Transcript_19307/g.42242 Transcript_19307/m.42242 type:complete len:301 (+) Transcript_19307:1142-2044(+)